MPGRSFAREPLEPAPTPFHGLRAPGAGPPSRPFLGRQFSRIFTSLGGGSAGAAFRCPSAALTEAQVFVSAGKSDMKSPSLVSRSHTVLGQREADLLFPERAGARGTLLARHQDAGRSLYPRWPGGLRSLVAVGGRKSTPFHGADGADALLGIRQKWPTDRGNNDRWRLGGLRSLVAVAGRKSTPYHGADGADALGDRQQWRPFPLASAHKYIRLCDSCK